MAVWEEKKCGQAAVGSKKTVILGWNLGESDT